MKMLLFGMGNVGKTTIGKELAKEINYPFYDVDDICIDEFGSINNFKDIYPIQRERDFVRSEIITDIIKKNHNCVIAPSVIAFLDDFYPLFQDKHILCVELMDTPENIFKRLIFTDDDDQIIQAPDDYLKEHEQQYMEKLKDDFEYFHNLYKNVMPSINMDGKTIPQIVNELKTFIDQ